MTVAALRRLLEYGDHPLRADGGPVEITEGHATLRVRQQTFRTRDGEAVRGLWVCPEGQHGPHPTVLLIHAHGGRYDIGADELLTGRPELHAAPGPALAARGIASFSIDLPCFGTRRLQTESAAAKARLWEGRSLAGQMVGELKSVLDWLAAQPGVDAERIGVFGLSMGALLGCWLAALDPRVRALAQECCLADFRQMIALGAHDGHGIWLTVPGLLPLASNGTIAGMIAPRAQFVGLGGADRLTPGPAARIALAEAEAGYAARGGRLDVHHEPDGGHAETPAMHAAMLDFMARELGRP